jgi:hypothetical protein
LLCDTEGALRYNFEFPFSECQNFRRHYFEFHLFENIFVRKVIISGSIFVLKIFVLTPASISGETSRPKSETVFQVDDPSAAEGVAAETG